MPLLLLLFATAFNPPECGDPTRESMSWRILRGEVLSVGDNGELRLGNVAESYQSLRPRVVRIADVEMNLPAAVPFLEQLVGKKVTVWINPQTVENDHVIGVVYRFEADINAALLAKGLGRYVQPPAYSVSDYTLCEHRIAEREARAHHRGLWK